MRDLTGVVEPTVFELTRAIADHEVFIIFTSDDDASDFRSWLDEEGWKLFQVWSAD